MTGRAVHRIPPWLFGMIPWAAACVAVAVMVVRDPADGTLNPLYGSAADCFWSRTTLYTGHWGMNYLPHFAVLYSPFHVLGVPAGDIAWRVVSALWLALGMWQLFRLADRANAGTYFFWGSLLALPICMGAIRNGQSNAIFAAATVQAVVFLVQRRWWLAALCLVLALTFKPLGIVMILLAPVVYRPLLPRLPVALLGFIAFPFLFGPWSYVASEHVAFVDNVRDCAAATEHRFDNVDGILRTIGIEPAAPAGTDPQAVGGRRPVPHLSTALSLLGALATLAAWWIGGRRASGLERGLLLLTLTTSYLMLFNPMNEGNGYVIVAPALAVAAVLMLQVDRTRLVGWVLAALALSIGVAAPALYPVAPSLSSWWFPTATIIFLALFLLATRGDRTQGEVLPEAA